MKKRYVDLEDCDLTYIAKYGYLESLEHCTQDELTQICESVGLNPKGGKKEYLSALEDYRVTTLGRGSFNV